ncbi:MAG: hypothetical protein ABR602_12025 [Gemmatimonadales bacterium]
MTLAALTGCGTGTTEPACEWGIAGTIGVFGIPNNLMGATLTVDGQTKQSLTHSAPQQVLYMMVPETCVASGQHTVVIRVTAQSQTPFEYRFNGAIAALRPGGTDSQVFNVNRDKVMATGDTVMVGFVLP